MGLGHNQDTIKITRFRNIAYTPFLKDFGTVNHWLIKIPGGIRQLAREFFGLAHSYEIF